MEHIGVGKSQERSHMQGSMRLAYLSSEAREEEKCLVAIGED